MKQASVVSRSRARTMPLFADWMYVITSIKSGKFRIDKDGQQCTVLGKGDIFGEMSFLGRYQYCHRCQALHTANKYLLANVHVCVCVVY
jgi:hypothetical protein